MLCSNSQLGDAAVSSGCTIAFVGSVLGMQFDALTLGFIAGVIVLSFQAGQTFIKMVAGVFLSTLLAGSMAPLVSAAIVHYFPFAAEAGLPATRMACAVIIGVSAQTVLPAALKRLQEYVSGLKLGGQ